MAQKRLFLCNKLSSLVIADEQRFVSVISKDNLVSKSAGVLQENITFSFTIEIKEHMAVKNAEFRSVAT